MSDNRSSEKQDGEEHNRASEKQDREERREQRRKFRIGLLDPTVKPLWSERRILLLGFGLSCIVGMIIVVGAWTAVSSLKNCERIQHLDRTVQLAGERNLKTLGMPGGTAYAYYHAHPEELARARAQLIRQIHDFESPSCSSLPF